MKSTHKSECLGLVKIINVYQHCIYINICIVWGAIVQFNTHYLSTNFAFKVPYQIR